MSFEVDRFPLSFAQQRMWFLSELDPGSSAYNQTGAIRMRGRLDREALARAVAEIVDRHETLRTVIEIEDGKPVQAILPEGAVRLESEDLRDLSPEAREAEARARASEEGRKPFDLPRGPLARMKLFRLEDEDHVLVVVMHHIVSDAWSVAVFFRELGLLYQAFAEGKTSPLEPLPVQYADYAAWQREQLEGDELARHVSYWRRKLDSLSVLELPADRSRPSSPSLEGGRRSLVLSEALTSSLEELSRRERATLFMTLWAAFSALLSRYSGQEDVAIGAAIANRNRKEIEGLIGFFVNTLVLRADLSGDPTFAELLRRSRETALEAYEHQDLPFEKLVEELHPQRQLSRNPLFQVMFGFQNVPELPVGLSGLALSGFDLPKEAARFDLTLFVTQSRGRLLCSLEFATDLFDPDRIERLLQHFETLLGAVASNPGLRVSELPLLRDEERAFVLSSGRRRHSFAEPRDSIHARFERVARARPEAVALTLPPDTRVPYRELEENANRLARHLLSLGVQPETRVAICLERSTEMVTAILATLKAGAAYVPMDPGYPEARLRFLLADAAAPVVLTEKRFLSRFGETSSRMVCLDEEREEIAQRSADPPPGIDAGRDALAYIIYTSGSTGSPKGVAVTHGNVLRLLDRTEEWYRFGPEDVWTLFHSYAFDFSVWEIWGALLYGGRLVVVPFEVSRSPEDFHDLLQREAVTVLNQTPSAFSQLAAFCEGAGKPDRLRYVIFGGEALHPSDWGSWIERHGDRDPALINMYGITETTVHVTYRLLSRADLDARGESLIGSPIPDLDLYLLDRSFEPVPIGIPGEIFVGGAGLARGYWKRPEVTAERFVPHPFGTVPGERLYRSGDLAVRLPNGELDYLGRIDHQVKLRGFRIELGEIESALEAHPAVERAVALLRQGPSGEDRIVAYVVPDRREAGALRGRLGRSEASLLELPDGRAVHYLNASETRFMYEEIFERGAYERHGVAVPDGAVVFDVGANIGMFSLYAAEAARDVIVHAFEPMPEPFEALSANQTLHGFQGKAHPLALGAKPGREEFVYYPNLSVLSGRFADQEREREVVLRFLENEGRASGDESLLRELVGERLEARRFECEVQTLSQVLRETGVDRVDLLKIDVEKSELEVLQGIEEGDWPKVRQIVVEVHDEGGRLEAIEDLLSRHGFRIERDQDPALAGTGLWNLYAVRDGRPEPGERRRAIVSAADLVGSLRRAVSEALPDYMVPASFVLLPGLPLTAHGKLDLAALAESEEPKLRRRDKPQPESEAERALAAVWREVLGLDEVGLDDNFFEVGGDSILGIQVVSRAKKAGWKISAKDIFRHQTLSELAAAAKPIRERSESPAPEEAAILTPIQRWFFELELLDPHHFNHAVLLEVAPSGQGESAGDPKRMASAIEKTFGRHDVFRSRFALGGPEPAVRFDVEPGISLARIDLSALPPREAENALERAADALQKSLDLAKGPLARAAWFHMGEASKSRLLLVCHHLVVDGVSWRLLLEEIGRAYEGSADERGATGASHRAWAAALGRYARSSSLERELPFWRAIAAERSRPLPKDRPLSPDVDLVGRAQSASASLDREETRALLETPSQNRLQVMDVLVTAIVATIGPWSGNQKLLVDIESHGREEIEDVDPASIVGWLTSIFPIVLRHEATASLDRMLDAVKEQLGRVPRNGIGYGVLRYLSAFPGVEELRSMPKADLIFNYLGRFASKGDGRSAMRTLPGPLGATRNPRSRRHHSIEVTAVVVGDELRVEWTYSPLAYERETMESLARGYVANLRALLSSSRLASGEAIYSAAEFGGRTSSAGLEKALDQVDFE